MSHPNRKSHRETPARACIPPHPTLMSGGGTRPHYNDPSFEVSAAAQMVPTPGDPKRRRIKHAEGMKIKGQY
jgi:hypothetical protein